ncbi:reverse transcriptase domain-containing protein [Tanacetum coccineum]
MSQIAQSVADALAEQEIQRYTNLNGDGSQGFGSGITRPVSPTRECTYSDFLICHPLNFKGTEGVVGLTQWFERKETWNSHVKTVDHDAAYGMPWKTLMKMMTVKYCPRSEIKKLEIDIWNLKVKGTDVMGYTQRFQELALMCGRDVGGLPDMIQGNVMSARPKTMQEAIELANGLMDQKVRACAERKAKNKRKFNNNNQAQQQLPKRQNVAQSYAARTGERKEYVGTLPL